MSEPASPSVKELAADVAILIRQELALAREELAEKAKYAGMGAGMFSAAAVSAMIALASLTALIAVGLSLVIPVWLAVAIVTVLWGGAAGALAIAGKRAVAKATPFVPEQTIAGIKEDVAFATKRRG
jgi:fatty acid desaturase